MSKIQAKAILFCILISLGTTRAYSNIPCACRRLVLIQHYSLRDFPQSEAWGFRTGREDIYPESALAMVDHAIKGFFSKEPPITIFSELARSRRSLAKRMAPFASDRHINAFGYLRWTPPYNQTTGRSDAVDAMAGYSELARLDDGDDSYFRNGELSNHIRDRFREIVNEYGISSLDTKIRQPLQDEYADYKKWIFQRRNYVHTTLGERPGDEVFKITNRVMDTKSHLDFMRLIFCDHECNPNASRKCPCCETLQHGSLRVHIWHSNAIYDRWI